MQSAYDPTRLTVGSIYNIAQSNGERGVICGDLSNELAKSLVDDLNNTIKSNPFEGRDFYITVHEKKDLQMPNSILRRMIVSEKRPYPEDDTVVFKVNPVYNDVKFCWCLPHWSEMDNILANPDSYPKDYIIDIKAWKAVDLKHFGITKIDGKLKAIPFFKDRTLKKSH